MSKSHNSLPHDLRSSNPPFNSVGHQAARSPPGRSVVQPSDPDSYSEPILTYATLPIKRTIVSNFLPRRQSESDNRVFLYCNFKNSKMVRVNRQQQRLRQLRSFLILRIQDYCIILRFGSRFSNPTHTHNTHLTPHTACNQLDDGINQIDDQ